MPTVIFASASGGISRENLNCSVTESPPRSLPVAALTRELGLGIWLRVYGDRLPGRRAHAAVQRLPVMGCYEVSLDVCEILYLISRYM